MVGVQEMGAWGGGNTEGKELHPGHDSPELGSLWSAERDCFEGRPPCLAMQRPYPDPCPPGHN